MFHFRLHPGDIPHTSYTFAMSSFCLLFLEIELGSFYKNGEMNFLVTTQRPATIRGIVTSHRSPLVPHMEYNTFG